MQPQRHRGTAANPCLTVARHKHIILRLFRQFPFANLFADKSWPQCLCASVVTFLLFSFPAPSKAMYPANFIQFTPQPGSVAIAQKGNAIPLLVDANDYPGVVRAAGDLAQDIHRVTGITPDIKHQQNSTRAILIGTIGKSKLIDQLIHDKKMDASEIVGKWESFIIQTIGNNLVIAGSDKRGTIYGIYDLSKQIGVSPWYWWADVPSQHHDALFIKTGRYITGPPAVQYRGIFLNDEAPALTGWANEKFGGYNHKFYAEVFELLLRLRANYLWPAMWNNCFSEDDPLNPKLADEYGIVMGTSHVEPMMRADKEWVRAGYSEKQWNYQKYPQLLDDFWRAGLERNKPYENIITIGMRGKTDSPMSKTANIALLEKIVADQRKLIAQTINPDVTKVPQLWCLYKEVQEYYEKGMRVPDDVTLLWSDDNWGNIRRLPTPEERKRSGGAGIYYHFDYVGGPRNYKWIDTNPIPKVWEQMNLAHQYGANKIWIVNVGDLKPMEFPIDFFLSMAWNPDAWPKEKLADFSQQWAAQQFGSEHANEIAEIISKTLKFNGRRKPELLDLPTYSLTNYHEADRVLADYEKVVAEAEKVSDELPAEYRPAFFELVLHPAKSYEQVLALYIAAEKNHLYAEQNNPLANYWADQAEKFFAADQALSDYYNHTLLNGKWDHMMDQTHLGYTHWQEPNVNSLPEMVRVQSQTNAPPVTAISFSMPASIPFYCSAGFTDSDGYVSMLAEHYTHKIESPNARWEIIPDYGRDASAMSLFPVTASSVTPPHDSPRLEYKIRFSKADPAKVFAYIAPTQAFVPGRGLRMAFSFDDNQPEIVDSLADRSQTAWEESVKDNIRVVKWNSAIPSSGEHTLKIWMVDPGVVLEKIVIDLGGLKPSYLGPPETYRAPN